MALELPGWLVVAFNYMGLPWPGIDEDELRAWARGVRSFTDQVSAGTGRSGRAVAGLAAGSESSFTAALGARWEHYGRLVEGLRGPLDDFADALDAAAGAVVVQKEAVIGAAAALAAEFTATQLGAFFSLGADEAAVPAEVAAEQWVAKLALQELEAALIGKLVNGGVHLVSGHISRFAGELLGTALPVAMEAQSLKISYEVLRKAASEIRGQATETEDASTAAYKENASRSISDPGEGGEWPVARVVEEALIGVAADLFRSLPGVIFRVMRETASAMDEGAQVLEETDQTLAGEVPQVADPGPDGAGDPSSPAEPTQAEANAASEVAEDGEPSIPEWLLKRWRDGRKFNEDNYSRYEYNEVHLKSGKRVDSYNEDSEIVERKNTQIADVKENTMKSYIDSLRYKYKPGEIIGDTPKNRDDGIAKKPLKGDHILEVPPQKAPVPKNILDYATKHDVTIRDTSGKVYN